MCTIFTMDYSNMYLFNFKTNTNNSRMRKFDSFGIWLRFLTVGSGWFKVKRSENAKVGVKSPTDLGVDSHNTCGENNTQKLMENGVILPQLCLFLPLLKIFCL